MGKHPLIATILATIAVFSPLAGADIVEFQVAKVRLYEQTTSSPPAAPFLYVFDSYIDAIAGDIGTANVSSMPMTQIDPGIWELIGEYNSQEQLDAAAPDSVFTMNIQSGTLGTLDETLNLPLPQAYPAPPTITPASYQAGQDANPNLDLTIEWISPDSNTDLIFLSIIDVESDADIFDGDLDLGQTSYTIPASMLIPNHTYEIELAFANGELFPGTPTTGFGSESTGLAGYASVTVLTMTTSNGGNPIEFEGGVLKTAQHRQSADNSPPAPAETFVLEGFISTGKGGINGGDVLGGTVPLPMFEYAPGEWDADDIGLIYTSKPAFDSDFPSNQTYTMLVYGGSIGDRSQDFQIGADAYPDPAHFTGTVLSDLQGMDPYADFTLQWSTPGADVDVTALFIDRIDNGNKVYENIFASPSVTQLIIPAGFFDPGVEYEIGLALVNADKFFGTGAPAFDSDVSLVSGFLTDTLVTFTTENSASCTPDLTGDGVLDFFDVSAFLTAFSTLDPAADFTNDGSFDFFDVSAFLTTFAAGCP